MGERLLCKQEVDGSIPFTSTLASLPGLEPNAAAATGIRLRESSFGSPAGVC